MFGLGPARIRRLSARVLPAAQKACSGRPRQIIPPMTQFSVFTAPSVTAALPRGSDKPQTAPPSPDYASNAPSLATTPKNAKKMVKNT